MTRSCHRDEYKIFELHKTSFTYLVDPKEFLRALSILKMNINGIDETPIFPFCLLIFLLKKKYLNAC